MIKKKKYILFILIVVTITGGISFTGVASGKMLPEDADHNQIICLPIKNETGAYLDSMKSFYDSLRTFGSIMQEPLMGLNKDLEVAPLGAEYWKVSEDGLNWTFHLRKGLKWSDGAPVTAHDYVFALQRAVINGYDFSWYWSTIAGIKNWERVEKNELPVDELGIKALDDYTLTITTETPKPFLAMVLTRLYPTPRHAVQRYGDEYATRAETMVGNGPFMVIEWVRGSHITLVQNPYYEGIWPPYLEKIVLKYGTFDPETGFPAYLNDEIHYSELNAGQLAYVKKNLPEELYSGPMLRLFYLSFDTTKPPFNDVRVRQAFNHAINREELCSTVLRDVAIPEYSVLMKGFPGYDPIQAKELSEYDLELAKKLLAEAGYPDGEGFPEQELWVRNASQHAVWQIPAAAYLQAQLKEALGVNIIPRLIEVKTYTDALNQYSHNLFLATYGFDYLDPSNFMDLFLTNGRHSWPNPDYNRLVNEADSAFDWEERIEKYREAEQVLIQEAPAIFIFQAMHCVVWKPFLKVGALEKNKEGTENFNIDDSSRYIASHIYVKKND
ncbi:MAG TPA: peptide ABC transporter substrate-binding protein [Atribacterota bacterium]|nr:peptide ABC transporter substrate-binding protein [Atribacterota bacterium]